MKSKLVDGDVKGSDMGGIWLVEVKMNYNKKELPAATSACTNEFPGPDIRSVQFGFAAKG